MYMSSQASFLVRMWKLADPFLFNFFGRYNPDLHSDVVADAAQSTCTLLIATLIVNHLKEAEVHVP